MWYEKIAARDERFGIWEYDDILSQDGAMNETALLRKREKTERAREVLLWKPRSLTSKICFGGERAEI